MIRVVCTFTAIASVSSLIFVLVLVFGNLPVINSEEAGKDIIIDKERGPFNCVKLMMRGAKSTMKALTPCNKEVKEKAKDNKDYSEKIGCIMKCAMHRVKLVNDEYHLTKETMGSLIRTFSPSQTVATAVTDLVNSRCSDEAEKLDPKDEYCRTYANYTMCLQTSMDEFIQTSEFCIKREKKEKE